jgi:hypothetical protein
LVSAVECVPIGLNMMLKVLCERAAITVILVEVSAYARIPTILPEESQAVDIYSSSALVKSFARIALKRAPTVGQRKKRCLQSPQ